MGALVASGSTFCLPSEHNVDPEEDKDRMGFQKAKRDLRAVYDHSDSESSDNERRKMLYVMFGGSWDITSCRIIKNMR
jgi:hypothetical protein